MTKPNKENDNEVSPSTEIFDWLQQQKEFDMRYNTSKFGVLESKVSKFAEKFDPISSLDDEFYEYTGGKDKDQECHGSGYMEYDDGSHLSGSWKHGRREGHFRLDTQHPLSSVYHLQGDYKDDELCGRARVQLKDESWQDGWYKDSVLHGFCRKFDKYKNLTWIGIYRNGKAFGVCWSLLPGGGCVVGDVNEEGELSGEAIGYIYPDLVTSLVGHFKDGVLARAVRARLTGVKDQYSCIKVPQFEVETEDVYLREVSTCDFITTSPQLRDPYETQWVEVRQSRVDGAEDGLFCRQNVKAGTVLAFYNGIRRQKPADSASSWQLEENAYKIFDPTSPGGVLDIPQNLRSLTSYSASLAHKTNHSFIPNCEFGEFLHPRFGLVPSILAIHDIGAGEEIFVWYGYDLDYCPQWYMDAWAKGDFAVPDSMKKEYGIN